MVAVSPNNVHAAGIGLDGYVYHRQGAKWTRESKPFDKTCSNLTMPNDGCLTCCEWGKSQCHIRNAYRSNYQNSVWLTMPASLKMVAYNTQTSMAAIRGDQLVMNSIPDRYRAHTLRRVLKSATRRKLSPPTFRESKKNSVIRKLLGAIKKVGKKIKAAD